MKTLEELNEVRDRMSVQIEMRRENHDRTRVVIGMGNQGIAGGARQVLRAFSDLVQEKRMTDKVTVMQDGSFGEDPYIPVVKVMVPGRETVTYVNMTPEKAAEVVESHLIKGRVVEKYTLEKVKSE